MSREMLGKDLCPRSWKQLPNGIDITGLDGTYILGKPIEPLSNHVSNCTGQIFMPSLWHRLVVRLPCFSCHASVHFVSL